MAVFNGAFPVLPGKEDAARAFGKEVAGPRRDQFDAMQRRGGIERETWSFQESPDGLMVLVWFEGDVEKAFAELATDQDEFAVWFRAQVLEINGVDLAAEPDGPPPEILVEWSA